MPINGYFDTVFAVAGDVVTVPDATQPSGTVSYTQGFPITYSTPAASGGYNVPRTAMNQLFKDITGAIQYMQQGNSSAFITSAMNGGSPYSYSKYARVKYNSVTYVSLEDSNTDTPPSSKWAIDFGGVTGSFSPNQIAVFNDTTGTIKSSGVSIGALAGLSAGANLQVSGSTLNNGNRRLSLTANTTFYVATTGSNSNDGTSGSPWLTLQYAVDYIRSNIDLNGYAATISVANGTYTSGVTVSGPFVGSGSVTLLGNNTTPSSCVISTTSADCIAVGPNVDLYVRGFKLTAATSGSGINAAGGNITINGNMEYGAIGSLSSHIAAQNGGTVNITSNYSISAGGGLSHYQALNNSYINVARSITVTLTGTPAFTYFTLAFGLGIIVSPQITYSGSATGARYAVSSNGVINTEGGGANFYPGNSAGSSATGGQYI